RTRARRDPRALPLRDRRAGRSRSVPLRPGAHRSRAARPRGGHPARRRSRRPRRALRARLVRPARAGDGGGRARALARAPGRRVRALRRVHPLYWLALALLVASVVFTAATAKAPESVARTASVYDAGPGGAAALRRYLDVMGAATITLQGDAFDPDPARAGVLFVLAPAELVTTRDVDALRRYVESGGTLVFASDLSIFERSLSARLLEDLDVRIAGRLAPGTYDAGGRAVAFDEYHHGIHPTGDVFILLERTWPGRALVFAMVSVFAYLVLSGRRLGPPVPLEVRAARSSLEYVRGFAGLVRRSGHGEIARRRLRRELRARLARRVGLDADMPFERIASALGANDPGAAARATAL